MNAFELMGNDYTAYVWGTGRLRMYKRDAMRIARPPENYMNQ